MTILKPPSQPGCEWVEECIEVCDGPTVFVDDRGVRATFLNPRREKIRKITYDGCYRKDEPEKQADFILGVVGVIDIIVELKGSDTNLRGGRGAGTQVGYTLEVWRQNPQKAPKIAALIIYGRIEGRKKRPGRRPRANAAKESVELDFLRRNKVLLLIHENGRKQFRFNDFIRKSDAR
jgi:hypothetical protein